MIARLYSPRSAGVVAAMAIGLVFTACSSSSSETSSDSTSESTSATVLQTSAPVTSTSAVRTTTTEIATTWATTTIAHTGQRRELNCGAEERLDDDDSDGWGTCVPLPTTLPPKVLDREACEEREVVPEGQFSKNSEATQGECLHFWAAIFQFDSNTGPCSFLANYGEQAYARSYRFGDAIIRVDGFSMDQFDIEAEQHVRFPSGGCDLLEPIVEGDLVEVWAYNDGTDSYDTVGGGSNSYTKFVLVDIEKYR